MRTNGFCARLVRLAAVATLLVSMSGYTNAAALTQIDVSSGVYGGLAYSFTPADGTISTTASFNGGAQINFNGPGHFWSFDFSPMYGATLSPGNYPSAQRFPSQKRPGMEIDGDGSGCNTLTGLFTIHEATFDLSGNIVSLAIDAKQNCGNTLGATPLVARIRINSSVPLVVATPQSIAGLPQEAYEHTLITLDGSQSYEPESQITAWKWSQASGPAVVIESPSAPITRFRAPEVTPGGADVVLQLDIADVSGQHATSTIQVHVFDKRDRRTWLTWRSPQGDYVGGGLPLAFSAADGGARIYTYSNGLVRLDFDGGLSSIFDLDFAPPASGTLTPGTYMSAQRFADSTHAGLDVSGFSRGCDFTSGQFSVLEANLASGPPMFGARFVQSCETTEPPLRGTVLFNSIAPGNPAAHIVGPTHAAPGTRVTLDGSQSSSSGSTLVAYRWRQISGSPVTASDWSQPTLQFTMPSLMAATIASHAAAQTLPEATASPDLQFELEIDDEDGLVDVAQTDIAAAEPVAAPVNPLGIAVSLGLGFALSGLIRIRRLSGCRIDK